MRPVKSPSMYRTTSPEDEAVGAHAPGRQEGLEGAPGDLVETVLSHLDADVEVGTGRLGEAEARQGERQQGRHAEHGGSSS